MLRGVLRRRSLLRLWRRSSGEGRQGSYEVVTGLGVADVEIPLVVQLFAFSCSRIKGSLPTPYLS